MSTHDIVAPTIARMNAATGIDRKLELFNRDSLPPIFRLPTEILEAIFIHRACDHYSKHGGYATETAPSWVNVSYVCRRWRNVALNCSTLWTYFFVTSPRWTEELVARSKQAPLKLHVNPDSSCGDLGCGTTFLELDLIDQVMNHVERVEDLHLCLPLTCSVHQFFSKLSSPAPRLRDLKISTEGASSDWSPVLFNGDTPSLRTLELTSCPVPWYSFELSGLTTLSLNDVSVQLQQTTSELLCTLSRMKNLKYLHLDNALASAANFLSRPEFHGFQKIDLPHLSRFSIVAPLSTVIVLLSCVNIPLKTEVRLECHFERDSSLDDYTSFPSLLVQRFGNDRTLSTPTIRSLGMESAERGIAILTFSAAARAFNSSISISHAEWDRGIPLQVILHFRPSMSQSDGDRIISDLCRSLPLTRIQSVHVLYPPSSPAFWKVALGHLSDLRYIKLTCGPMPDLASVLALALGDNAENEGGHASQGPDRVFAPLLEELELYDILFSISSPGDLQSLYGALSTREKSRGRLAITQCAVAAKNSRFTKLDATGRWEHGHFHLVESTV